MFGKIARLALPLLVLAAAAPAAAASFVVSVEAPKATNTTTSFTSSGVETFDGRAIGGSQTFTDSFGTITATYTGVSVVAQDQYGGAGGNYATTPSGTGYTIDVVNSAGSVNYFGYFLSALNGGNTITFYKNGAEVAAYDVSSLAGAIGANGNYKGNPATGQNGGEQYAFINFYDQGGTFDRVVVSGAGHESDNHTFGTYSSYGGTVLSGSVPEPATWMAMILGFGMIGTTLRRERAAAVRVG